MPKTGDFLTRVANLPALGVGLSTEYGAGEHPGALDPAVLAERFPNYAGFLEVGVETALGLDRHAVAWAAAGRRTTYHFLDVNLDDPEDFDAAWLEAVLANVAILRPAWLCGDAGLWHFGARDRGQMLLLPPVLTPSVAEATATGIRRLREVTGLEVLPENPPGAFYLGSQHLLDYFATLVDRADTGMLLDAAHLAIYQLLHGHHPLTGLLDFPMERIVELHVAGSRSRDLEGFVFHEDDHGTTILPETWRIVEAVVARAPNLKAIVFEGERNRLHEVTPALGRLHRLWEGRGRRVGEPCGERMPAAEAPISLTEANELQALAVEQLFVPTRALPAGLAHLDARAFRTDPRVRQRVIGAIVEEFPVSVALVGVPAIDEFFASDAFTRCVRERGSLGLSAGDWLMGRVGAVARLELTLARSRRRPGIAPSAPGLRLPAGSELLVLPTGAYGLWASLHGEPGGALSERVAAGLRHRRPDEGEATEWVLVRPNLGGEAVEALPDAVGELLAAVSGGMERVSVIAEAVALGAMLDEATEIVDGLVADGLLVAG